MKTNLIELIEEVNYQLLPVNSVIENKVSQLIIHCCLYISYGKFWGEFQRNLFNNARFKGWKYGVVEVDALKNIHHHKFIIELNEQELDFLKIAIKKILTFSAWSLIYFIQTTKPWTNYYQENLDNVTIPNKIIKTWFYDNRVD